MQKRAAKYALLFTAAMLSGCSTFNRDWDRMAGTPQPKETIEGRWDGTWKSDATGHKNRLRCILSKKNDDIYEARFHAKYKILFPLAVGYTVPLKVRARDGKYHFEGEKNLHWYAGGVYHYDGAATATNFFSNYRCKSDHGSFEMIRP